MKLKVDDPNNFIYCGFNYLQRREKKMNLDELTIAQIKKLSTVFGSDTPDDKGVNFMVNKKCIIRTYAAGVWFGEVVKKSRNEVVVKDARRLWRWHTKKSISLSAIAMGDINEKKCRIAGPVPNVWLEAIELIPCNDLAIEVLEGAKIDEAS